MYLCKQKCANMNTDTTLTIRIKKEKLTEYKKYCDENGYNLSKRLRNYIESELKSTKKESKNDIR